MISYITLYIIGVFVSFYLMALFVRKNKLTADFGMEHAVPMAILWPLCLALLLPALLFFYIWETVAEDW
jgi:heme/copper-type cytochrome/quinol oxidase subunit 2